MPVADELAKLKERINEVEKTKKQSWHAKTDNMLWNYE
jgi:hypothetical protein